ncbi:hypothetical protein AMTRI_Chr08g202110 [Amborella trichopoda]
MFTAKKPTDEMFTNGTNLHEFVNRAYPHQVMEIVDIRLLKVGATDKGPERLNEMQPCLIAIMGIGLSCTLESPKERMDMRDVLKHLQNIRNEIIKLNAKSDRERGLLCDILSSSSSVPIVIQPSL